MSPKPVSERRILMKKRYAMPAIDIAYFDIIGCSGAADPLTASVQCPDDGVGKITLVPDGQTPAAKARVAAVDNVLKFEVK